MSEEQFSFGYWLRRQRLARDLRQADLAQQLGIAPITLRKIEADERRPSLQLIARLADLFAMSEADRALLLKVARADLSPAALALPDRPDALPEQTARATPLDAWPSGTVTFLLTDIVNSTRLWEEHPDPMRAALAQHNALLYTAITQHAGVLVKGTGDGVIAAFALAEDGLAAALTAQRALAAAPWGITGQLMVRMALHSGAAEPQQGDYFGPTLNRAARLLATGYGRQILLSRAAAELLRDQLPSTISLRDLGSYRLKDLAHPEQVLQVVAPDLPSEFPALRTLDVRRHNLPTQATALIGREREVAEMASLLERIDTRVLTLFGPGGTGKTRLALQAAAELIERYADGVWFVNLAPVRDPALVIPTIAQTLDVREMADRDLIETLADALRGRSILLILDNFEQVVDAAPNVATLVGLSDRATFLITSRESLRIAAERLFHVSPLPLPNMQVIAAGDSLLPEAISQYAAILLFIERARAVRPDFTVTNTNAPAVAAICERLDGLPLAIELAAARIRLFTPEALLSRLEHRLPLLTGGARDLPLRQQTLRDTITWSYALLSADEQRMLVRLAVFAGGWSLSAAAAIAAEDEIVVLDRLVALADKSLVRIIPDVDGAPRFTMLETIREYSLEQLEQSGLLAETQDRHAAYVVQWATTVAPELNGPRKAEWYNLCELEHDNVRVALNVLCARGDYAFMAQLVIAIWRFWFIRGYWREGWRWMLQINQGLASDATPEHTALQSRLLAGLTWMAIGVSEFALGKQYAQESLRIVAPDDLLTRAHAWMGLAHSVFGLSDLPAAVAAIIESHALYMQAGDHSNSAYTLDLIGYGNFLLGNLEAAQSAHEQALEIARNCGDLNTVGAALSNRAMIALVRGDYAQAEAFCTEGLELHRQIGDRHAISTGLIFMGLIAFAQGHYQRTEELNLEALELRRFLGDRRGTVAVLSNLSRATARQGRLSTARDWFRQGVALAREINYLFGFQWSLYNVVEIVLADRRFSDAACVLGATDAFNRAHELTLDPDSWKELDWMIAQSVAALGDAAFQAAWAKGGTFTLEEALALVNETPAG